MNKKNRRKIAFTNKMHKEIFWAIFLAAFLSAGIVSVALYYLIFGITAEQIGIPEAIAYNIIPASQRVVVILLFAAPLSILTILVLAYKTSNKIIGPFDRVVKELGDCLNNKKRGHIIVRKGDKFQLLVDKINELIDRAERI